MRRYAPSYFSSDGQEDQTRCIAMTSYGKGDVRSQCNMRRGKGPEGLYCGTHAKVLCRGRVVNIPEDDQKT